MLIPFPWIREKDSRAKTSNSFKRSKTNKQTKRCKTENTRKPDALYFNRKYSSSICGYCCCCSVAQLCSTLQTHGLQHARLPCLSPSPGVCSNSCLLSCDAIQPCHLLTSPSSPASSLSQDQGLFQ